MNVFHEQTKPSIQLHRVDCPACNPSLHTYLETKSATAPVNLPLFGLMTTEEQETRFSDCDTPVPDCSDEESLEGEFDVGPLGPCSNDPRYPEEWIGQWKVFEEEDDEDGQAPQRYSLHLFEVHRWVDVELPPISNKQEFEIVLNEAKGKFGFGFTGVAYECKNPVIVPKYVESPSPARSSPEEHRCNKKRRRETDSPDPEERPNKRMRT